MSPQETRGVHFLPSRGRGPTGRPDEFRHLGCPQRHSPVSGLARHGTHSMPLPGTSPSNVTFSRLLAVAAATLVVALAFGADFGLSDDPNGYAGWEKSSGGGLGAIFPWGNSAVRRKFTPLQDAKMRLSDERKRRMESEK